MYLSCNSSSVSAYTPKSSAYSSSHKSSFLAFSLYTYITTTNRKQPSADPWCILTVIGNSADTPHSILALVVAPLYIFSTTFTICSGTPFFLWHQNVTSLDILPNDFSTSTKAHYRLLLRSNIFSKTCLTIHVEYVVPFPFMNQNCIQ